MINLEKLIPRTAEEYLAIKVTNKISEYKHRENSLFRAMIKYEKLVNSKEHKYHPLLRMHIETQYETFIENAKNTLDKHTHLIEKYKLVI